MQRCGDRCFPEEGTSREMAQRLRYTWPVQGAERKPVWLESSEGAR